MANLVRGFPNIAVLPDRPPNGLRSGAPRDVSRRQLVTQIRDEVTGA
jgi:hypothetical protein